MTEQTPRVLIIGAGSMGLIVGYILSLAKAEVTFLVRPHRQEELNRPQVLYSYDDNQLKTYKDYKYITEPSKMIGADYDYILITLDAHALRSQVGLSLVKTIGDAVRGTQTKVVLATAFIDLRSWFLEVSGISGEQVTYGLLLIHAYAPRAATLPLHDGTDPTLLEQADQAYTDSLGPGFIVDDSSPAVAEGFAELYNASGLSTCAIMPAAQLAVFAIPLFPVLAACDLLGWPKFAEIDSKGEVWNLAVEAAREIQKLSMMGEPGQKAAATITDMGLAAQFAEMEKQMLPLDFSAFDKYHHGGKVNVQDRELLNACVSYGEAEGKTMSALKELIKRVESQ
ncbi:hypothetical protein LTR99_001356 [Exophiala xenobiotica]|uniref:Ketopantoate reductase N-terminal domain-containing protein n=1 Tax=Vermiconidia calcicola TaxID=1690605 RepID=A0AAV9QMQ6_9PEZI|nr:hypothetical protein LTR41_009397 [Exophiala xenobiotica]KAK5545918.1 hypothetical protein LTR25_000928 [Vermiconidia calcicola]KAK5549823.1 hypothetical protein LTR23_000114 [Chaetothyriales sp. CCFEE 6169]KAK5308381.1 hypothetical protein LTR99_001356 [Exophiala xenobiotica]KAK5434887.1 hypothetical protein LTR18_009986 [Exophiala xenobiotica]